MSKDATKLEACQHLIVRDVGGGGEGRGLGGRECPPPPPPVFLPKDATISRCTSCGNTRAFVMKVAYR
jgi:hypothetical protein